MPLEKLLGIGDIASCQLEQGPWELRVLAAGETVFQRVQIWKPDLILVVAPLPNTDAVALLDTMQQTKATAGIPSVVLAREAFTPRQPGPGLVVLPWSGTASNLASQLCEHYQEALLRLRLQWLAKLGGAAFLQEMTTLFRDTATEQVAAIRNGLEVQDYETVERSGHSLKSSAGNLGADHLQGLAAQVERLAGQRQRDALAALVPKLEGALVWVNSRLQS